jgi:biopolymer transport protein ExbD
VKLVSTLPERPGFLHAVPVFDLFALLLLFFLLGPSMVLQSGVSVELPPSRFQMERYRDVLVVTLGPGEPELRMHLGRDAVTEEQLATRLDALRKEGAAAKTIVLVRTDIGTPVGLERKITELILAKGFRVALVGRAEATPEAKEEAPDEPLPENR